MKILLNAWFWFAIFCVALYFIVLGTLSIASNWANSTVYKSSEHGEIQ